MNAWDHLPNAHHIDWVLESVKQHPKEWLDAWNTTFVYWNTTSVETQDMILDVAWARAHATILDTDRGWTWHSNRVSIESSSQSTVMALVAYDDCAHLLDMPSEKLRAWALLREQPAAVLQLPSVIAGEQIRELEQA